MPTISEFFGNRNYDVLQRPCTSSFSCEIWRIRIVDTHRTIRNYSRIFTSESVKSLMEWAALHQLELLKDWKLAESYQKLEKIAPLE